jgi:hypothetical protein
MAMGDRELWRLRKGTVEVLCVMISCCAGAELQIREGADAIGLRELYPDRSTLYERARELRKIYEAAGYSAVI